ncbi:hypothetical protein PISL3812_06289 [Talaromyces islandicus]|uniref:Uncharacterized protein n=1 Tax=Talaromyces islandicus TaxID=28573 RepID=A0A0U1M130_TALIS|nr:hypothetical protein PISL3812_06289 [Talaromyces islandicus]
MVAPILGEVVQAGVNVSNGKPSKRKQRNNKDNFVDLDMRMVLPPGVSQHDVDLCKNANKNSTGVRVIQESNTSLRVENVEPECMALASLFDDEGTPAL